MQLMTYILTFFFVTIFSVCSYCQYNGLEFESIPGEQGIADRYINAIIQDETGFIWIGSEDGLTKFDGYSSVVYRHKNNDPNSLADNEIYALCSDNEGALWIGTRNGLSRYDINNDRFENFFHDNNDPNSLAANEVFGLSKDLKGNIWIATYGGGLDMIEKKSAAGYPSKYRYNFIHYRHNEEDSNSLSNDQAFAVCFDNRGNAWIATANGLNLYNLSQKKFTRFYHEPSNKNSIAHGSVYKIFVANDGSIWVCGKSMLDQITVQATNKSSSFQIKHYLPLITADKNLSGWNINAFLIDNDRNGWIATNDQGLIKFTLDKTGDVNSLEKITRDESSPYSLAGAVVYALCEDKSSVIWIGTEKGISKYIPSKARFNEASLANYKEVNLNINALLTDSNNRLWLGYDSDTLMIIEKKNGKQVVQKIKLPGSFNDAADQVNVMYKSSKGDIYIGTMRQGIFVLENGSNNLPGNKRWLHITRNKFPALPTTNIYSFAEDKKGMIWIGTYKGVCRYDPLKKQLDSIYISPGGKAISAYIIRSLCTDERNFLWCGTDDGLYVLNDNKLISTYKNNPADSNSLTNDRVSNIMMDHHKNIWVCTKAGISLFNRATNNFKRITSPKEFPQDAIKILQEDEPGNLWIGTNHGLVKFDSKENKVYHYDLADGLCSEEFQTNSVCEDAAGIFYFGTNKGIVSFDPGKISPNNFVPPVVITNTKTMTRDIFSLGDTSLINTYRREKKLVLHYDQNFFSFEFAALSYINSSANQYAYILEGVDRQWNNAGTQRFAGYTDIQPGHYTFKVKASNNDGVWNEVPVTIDVIIIPPWWQTWWFYTLSAMAFCSVVYIIYRIRLKQILKLYKLRSSIAKDLHDDVGSALSSIALLSRIAQEGKTNARLNPGEIFSRIGDTSKRMIDLMDDIVWSVNPDNDRFNNMLVRMREYAAEVLEAKNINFTFKISKDIDELKIPMQTRKDYFLIFKEAVNNLVKYAECSNASIFIERINHHIITTINDDGKGFDQNILHSGNGLKNMQQRAEVLKGKLEIETIPGKGTSVILSIPVT